MGMEVNTNPVSFNSFRGWNTKLSEISISPREATDLQNVYLTQETVQVRYGNSIFTTTQLIEGGTPKAYTGLTQVVLGSTLYRVATGGTKIKSISGSGVLSDITGAVVITDNQNNLTSFAKLQDNAGADILIGANGVNPVWKWTGAGNAAALGGTPPANFKYIISHKNRLWGTSGEYLYHSDLLNAESWNALYWVARFKSEGISTNDLTGLGILGDNLVIFKEDKIYMLSGESIPEGYLQEVVSGDGCISGYSIVPLTSTRFGNILVFVNRNLEIKAFNGTKDLISISEPIDNKLNSYNTSRAQYVSAVRYNKQKHYLSTMSKQSSSTHNTLIAYDYYLDGFDSDPEGKIPRESTMLPYNGINANLLKIMDSSGVETLFTGTYDGWILKHEEGNKKDVVKASQIDAPAGGAVRAANVVTITTIAAHGFTTGDSIAISGVTDSSFNGTFTITVTGANTFTYNQTAANATSGNGIARLESNINAHWQSKRYSFGNAAYLKQLNDFDVVTVNNSIGQIKTTITTNIGVGQKTFTPTLSGALYGVPKYGEVLYGGTGISYNRVELDVGAGLSALSGRYFRVKIENVNGFIFGLEEFIMGVTSDGYQAEYIS